MRALNYKFSEIEGTLPASFHPSFPPSFPPSVPPSLLSSPHRGRFRVRLSVTVERDSVTVERDRAIVDRGRKGERDIRTNKERQGGREGGRA